MTTGDDNMHGFYSSDASRQLHDKINFSIEFAIQLNNSANEPAIVLHQPAICSPECEVQVQRQIWLYIFSRGRQEALNIFVKY